ncbi:hypothetical protein [Aeromonas dhakensis]|jgi:N-methylhydantoinase B/oxoprolinase/acetone carboxylase alpha subunit|uniref:hypothetical protein n=1 Tax=Aeromonas dhakensis TaxID=196024 RepID=UPI003987EEE8
MAGKELVRLAKAAQRAQVKANEAHQAWVEAFRAEYGHDDISDALVEVIDYARGDAAAITAEFIEANSAPDMS